jgi:hypothetical protein
MFGSGRDSAGTATTWVTAGGGGGDEEGRSRLILPASSFDSPGALVRTYAVRETRRSSPQYTIIRLMSNLPSHAQNIRPPKKISPNARQEDENIVMHHKENDKDAVF